MANRTQRGKDDVEALATQHKAQEALPPTSKEIIADLLTHTAQEIGKLHLTDQTIEEFIAAMVKDTEFDNATIEKREIFERKGLYKDRSLYIIWGDYASGHAYNVWAEFYATRGWVIVYHPIPKGGNLR